MKRRVEAPREDQNSAGKAEGEDPAVVDTKDKKLTGTGAPGSHSALFGLTPDGHKESQADYSSTKPKPAHSEEATGGGSTSGGGDSGSRAPGGSGVAEQINDPRVSKKGHGGDATVTDVESEKPGTGSTVMGPSQGSGQVRDDA